MEGYYCMEAAAKGANFIMIGTKETSDCISLWLNVFKACVFGSSPMCITDEMQWFFMVMPVDPQLVKPLCWSLPLQRAALFPLLILQQLRIVAACDESKHRQCKYKYSKTGRHLSRNEMTHAIISSNIKLWTSLSISTRWKWRGTFSYLQTHLMSGQKWLLKHPEWVVRLQNKPFCETPNSSTITCPQQNR